MSTLNSGIMLTQEIQTETATLMSEIPVRCFRDRATAGSLLARVIQRFCVAALMATVFTAINSGQAHAQSPRIFFTDLDSGPNSGGESVSGFSGAYVTLYGNFFGASQGASSVTWNGQSCLRVVPAAGSYSGWGAPYLWYQKIVVQLGSACTGTTGNFVVTVNGQASNGIPFTVRSGNIFCVSTSGNDGNNGKFPNHCWATIPQAKNTMGAGDVAYVENGVNQTASDSFDANLAIESNGLSGSPIALVVYPGATSTIGSPTGSVSYALRTPNIGGFHFWTIAGFIIRSSNIGVEVSGGSSDFRVVAMDASCPTAVGVFQGGCMDTATGVTNIAYLGNYDHDNAQISSDPSTSTKGLHNMYFSTDSNHIVAAWNLIDGDTGQNRCNGGQCNACRGIQFHSSPDNGGGPGDPSGHDMFDLHVHDNIIRNIHCDGINFATVDPSQGTVEAYNNLIYHVGTGVLTGDQSSFACIYFPGILNNGPPPSGTAQVYNNTCYDFGAPKDGESGAFSVLAAGFTVNFRNNIAYALSGQFYISPNGALDTSAYLGSNNLFFGNGSGPSFLSANVNSDPKFVNISSGDFHLSAGSPAIDKGAAFGPAADLDGITRPQGATFDIGAYEFFSPATITILSASPNPAQFGQPVTLTANVTAVASKSIPTGSVTFNDNGTALGAAVALNQGVATFSTSSLALGSHPLTAVYPGGGSFLPSSSDVLPQVINKDRTVTTVISSQNPVQINTSVTLTAGVSSAFGGAPTGNVTFVDTTTATNLGTASIASPLSASFAAIGLHTITATYNGDGNHLTSSVTFSQLVDGSGATATTTALSYVLGKAQPNSRLNQQQVLFRHGIALSATVNPAPPASEQVIFTDGSNVLGVASTNGTSTVSLAGQIALKPGSHSISAHYFGDSTDAPSSGTVVINQSPRPR